MTSPRRRILSVEDVSANRQLIALFLSTPDCEVDQAESGEEALLYMQSRVYDLVLMDLRLPGLGGLDVVRCIRRLEGKGRRTPIVALTADVLPQTVAEVRSAGLDGHIAKPFTSDSLRAGVAHWLARAAEPLALTPVLAELSERFGRTIVTSLLTQLAHQLRQLEETPDGDVGVLGRRAHALRGAAGSLGFPGVAQNCAALEDALKRGAPAAAQRHSVAQACAMARATISAELSRAA